MQVSTYTQLVAHWPALAQDVEALACATLRAALDSVKRLTSGASQRTPDAQHQQVGTQSWNQTHTYTPGPGATSQHCSLHAIIHMAPAAAGRLI